MARIVVIGQQAFGAKVLEELRRRGAAIVGVYTPPAAEGARPDPLAAAASAAGLPLFQPKRLRDPEVYERYQTLNPELNVMAFVTDIVPDTILNHPPLGTIQYHPSLLPRHRGGSAINWAVIQGETETGLSIFWPDAGLDTGPILLQKRVPIDPDDTTGSLYFQKLFPLGIEAMLEAVELVEAGRAPRLVQDESQATYEPLCREKHAEVDWARPAAELYNLIRGTDPQPGAWTRWAGAKLKLYDARLAPGDPGQPAGTVLAVADDGLRVAGNGGTFRIGRVQPEGGAKQAAGEWARQAGVATGALLGDTA